MSFRVLVTGASGQLGEEIKAVSQSTEYTYLFLSRKDLDITNHKAIDKLFEEFEPTHLINCAAYTAVDNAEKDSKAAFAINENSIQYLVNACQKHETKFVHFSTDYVYDNNMDIPMSESAPLIPKSVYAQSKLAGETVLLQSDIDHIILRTSWVYSSFGHNFLKTMLRLSTTHKTLSIVADQVGAPTYARDMAKFVMELIESSSDWSKTKGVYNFANAGQTNWAEYAKYIFNIIEKDIKINPSTTEDYGAPAPRPKWSVLDCSKLENTFNYQIPHWKESVSECIGLLQQQD